MAEAESSPPDWLVACLCAQWCGTCRDYSPTFEALALEFAGRARFVWVDIEDDAAVIGDVDVEDFPTLLVARDNETLFFGPVTPQPATARRLIGHVLEEGARTDRPADEGLVERIRRLRR
jgi:thioredoxin 1